MSSFVVQMINASQIVLCVIMSWTVLMEVMSSIVSNRTGKENTDAVLGVKL